MIFVNSRRLAERWRARSTSWPGEELVRAHHGSIAREQRLEIEEALKAGQAAGASSPPASLELGIDMGAVDLVVQSSRRRRSPRACSASAAPGHQVGEPSSGQDLPEVPRRPPRGGRGRAAHARRARSRRRAIPRNPLDVLAQQIVAIGSQSTTWTVDELLALVRRRRELRRAVARRCSRACSTCSPAATRPTSSPSCARASSGTASPDTLRAREGRAARGGHQRRHDPRPRPVRRVPPRRQAARRRARRGDGLRERAGEMFLLGAIDVAHRGDHARPRDRLAGARRAGQDAVLARRPRRPPDRARPRARRDVRASSRRMPADRGRDAAARRPRPRRAAPRATCSRTWPSSARPPARCPTDRTIVVERFRDELGDWRVCMLTPFGGRVHAPVGAGDRGAPRASAACDVADDLDRRRHRRAAARGRRRRRPTRLLLLDPDEIEDLVVTGALGGSALFAARFRENAARALLLPRRRPGQRTPLWMQRQRSADLLGVASRYRLVPDPARDVPRVPARRLRPARPAGGAGRHPARGSCAWSTRRDAVGLAVRPVAALRLRRRVSCTRATRRSPSDARRRSTLDRDLLARAARRRRAARAARPRGDR